MGQVVSSDPAGHTEIVDMHPSAGAVVYTWAACIYPRAVGNDAFGIGTGAGLSAEIDG